MAAKKGHGDHGGGHEKHEAKHDDGHGKKHSAPGTMFGSRVLYLCAMLVIADILPIWMPHRNDGWLATIDPEKQRHEVTLSTDTWSDQQHMLAGKIGCDLIIVTNTAEPCLVKLEDGSTCFNNDLPATLPDPSCDGKYEFWLKAGVKGKRQKALVMIAPLGSVAAARAASTKAEKPAQEEPVPPPAASHEEDVSQYVAWLRKEVAAERARAEAKP